MVQPDERLGPSWALFARAGCHFFAIVLLIFCMPRVRAGVTARAHCALESAALTS
jgi:hypothetical protein